MFLDGKVRIRKGENIKGSSGNLVCDFEAEE
jgi:hypothetical protein